MDVEKQSHPSRISQAASAVKRLNEVEIRNLRVGDSTLSLVFRRDGETTGFSLLSREGDVRVVMEE